MHKPDGALNGNGATPEGTPEGVFSLLDTDLYKLTMQCAVLKYFPDVVVEYTFTNRTPHMQLTKAAYRWLRVQIQRLANVTVTPEELHYLRSTCSYLNPAYLSFLQTFRLQPSKQVRISFEPKTNIGEANEAGELRIDIVGRWVDTILYEVPLLSLTSEAYFRFCDRDWTHAGQESKAQQKATRLLQHGCHFSEFGTRRRRDYHTQDLVLGGLRRAAKEGERHGWEGRLIGTSNVHFAMKHGISPVGTVAHEWFMGVAAITDDYEQANEIALRYWIGCFGTGVLGIALTDTFGSQAFLKAFRLPVPEFASAAPGSSATLPSVAAPSFLSTTASLAHTKPPVQAPIEDDAAQRARRPKRYADVFAGVRQDSGNPTRFIKMMRDFYDSEGIKEKKIIVFSDSLNTELCIEYQRLATAAGFLPTFGVGTFLTNDFVRASDGAKSAPLNIVIKLSAAAGRKAVKISDNIGKNTGDEATVQAVKRRLGYIEKAWEGGDERSRWSANGANKQPTTVHG